MTKSIYTFALILSATFVSCKKTETCTCTETYVGYAENYEIATDSILSGLEREQAEVICNEGDKPTQTILSESYTVECELK